MDGWTSISTIAKAICERARRVSFRGESPNEEWNGEVEVMQSGDGTVSLHVSRAHLKKYGGKKWHGESVYVTLSPEAWEHLRSVPVATVAAAA